MVFTEKLLTAAMVMEDDWINIGEKMFRVKSTEREAWTITLNLYLPNKPDHPEIKLVLEANVEITIHNQQ